MCEAKFAYKHEIHILCSMIFFFENHAACEIMWKNTAKAERPQIIIWRMRIACWIPKFINTLSFYVTLIAFSL